MMKTLKLLLTLLLAVTATTVSAQDEQKEINKIKSDKHYLYAMGTSINSAQEAADNAKDLLALEIEQWLKEKKSDDITGYVAKSRESLSHIDTQRGKLYRVFVYVKKADVYPYYKDEDVLLVEYNGQDAEPVAEPAAPAIVLTPAEKEMLAIPSFTALNDYINQGRQDKRITDVGKYSNLPKKSTVYVFIHNKAGEIPACLKVTDGQAVNMATGEPDVVSGYKGCGAIWIKVK